MLGTLDVLPGDLGDAVHDALTAEQGQALEAASRWAWATAAVWALISLPWVGGLMYALDGRPALLGSFATTAPWLAVCSARHAWVLGRVASGRAPQAAWLQARRVHWYALATGLVWFTLTFLAGIAYENSKVALVTP